MGLPMIMALIGVATLTMRAPAYDHVVEQVRQAGSSADAPAAVLFGRDTVAKDYFGTDVAVSGDTLVAGAYDHGSGTGAAYVFTKSSTVWEQTADLKGSSPRADEHFGAFVAISGDLIGVSAAGHGASPSRVYIFQRSSSGWYQVAELEGSGPAERAFGGQIAIGGNTVVVGGDEAVYVFSKTEQGWHQTAVLRGSDTVAKDGFGYFGGLAISGHTVVVGAMAHASNTGRAYVFNQVETSWQQVAELEGGGTMADDYFGANIAISGLTLVVSDSTVGLGTALPRAFVFSHTTFGWRETAQLTIPFGVGGDVAAAGDQISLGGTSVYVFTSSTSGWHQTAKLNDPTPKVSDGFGVAIAMSRTTVAVGAEGANDSAGRVYVYDV